MVKPKISSYEKYIADILFKEKIKYTKEKTFNDLRGGRYRYDFYLHLKEPIIIEVDGQYHFKPIHGAGALKVQKEHDRRKNSYCLANNIKLYRIPYWEINQIKTFSDMTKNKYLVKSKWHSDFLKVPH